MNGGEVIFNFKGNDKELTSTTNGLVSKLGQAGAKIGTAFLKGATVATGAMAGLVTASVKEFADLEQNIGGVETLFKESANTVIANAEKAYQTASMSANTYMETVTSFSASLLQSLGNDTAKASQYADQAIVDMSDNANKMGTSMEMIQNAYQGFAKQNYTMLDNLKLGYGGTKTEMERLIADANKVKQANGEMADLSIDSFADITEAIHIIQTEMGITGTTAKEASETISGSVNSAKSAFMNFLSGAGTIDAVVSTFTTAGTNISNAIMELAPKVLSGIGQLVSTLLPQAVTTISGMLPDLLSSGINLIVQLFDAIVKELPGLFQNLLPVLFNGAISLIDALVNSLPQIITMLAIILPQLIQTFSELSLKVQNAIITLLPTIIPTIVQGILQIIPVLLQNFPLLFSAGVQVLVALIQGIINAIPQLIVMIPQIIISIISTLISLLPQLTMFGPQIIMSIITGLISAIPDLVMAVPQMIVGIINALANGAQQFITSGATVVSNIWNGFKNGVTSFLSKIPGFPKDVLNKITAGFNSVENIGKNLVQGLWNGINNAKNWVLDKIKGFGKSVLKGIKDIFGIHSPSKEFAWVGKMNMLGFEQGMEDMENQVGNDVNSIFDGMFDLSPNLYGSTSNNLSPNINVTVNNSMETDPLGQMVSKVKTFSGGAKNDYNWGSGL